MGEERPSYLELDCRIASGEPLDAWRDDPEVAAHLERVADGGTEIPAWVLSLGPRRRRSLGRRWFAWAVPLAAVALLWLAMHEPYVGVKDAPSALLHVRRGDRTVVWDGVMPLRAGDRFRVELGGLGDRHYVVVFVHPDPDEPPVVLARGVGDGLVDGAWALDAPGAGGALVVAEDADPPRPARDVIEGPKLIVVDLK